MTGAVKDKPKPQPTSAQWQITRRSRRAQAYLLIATLMLAGAAVYVVALTRQQVWSSAGKGLFSLAVALQESTTALLQQSAFSLRAISDDIGRTSSPERVLAVLRQTMRFDPDSAYLGVWSPQRTTLIAIGHSGERVSAEVERALRSVRMQPAGPGFQFGAVVHLGSAQIPYLPLFLPKDTGGTGSLCFALIPIARLLNSAESLALVPASQVAFITADGQREFRYDRKNRFMKFEGRVPAHIMAWARHAPSGSWEFVTPYDGRKRVLAYSR